MKALKYASLLVIFTSFLASCGKEIPDVAGLVPPVQPADAGTNTSAPAAIAVAGGGSSSSASSAPSDPPVTYSALTKTMTDPNGFSYTVTGYVATFGGATYIWDDGVKAIVENFGQGVVVTAYYSFWDLCGTFTHHGLSGGCAAVHTDLLSAPTLDDGAIPANLTRAAASVDTVTAQGTQSTVNCSESAGVLDCGSFTIDTNQTPFLN